MHVLIGLVLLLVLSVLTMMFRNKESFEGKTKRGGDEDSESDEDTSDESDEGTSDESDDEDTSDSDEDSESDEDDEDDSDEDDSDESDEDSEEPGSAFDDLDTEKKDEWKWKWRYTEDYADQRDVRWEKPYIDDKEIKPFDMGWRDF